MPAGSQFISSKTIQKCKYSKLLIHDLSPLFLVTEIFLDSLKGNTLENNKKREKYNNFKAVLKAELGKLKNKMVVPIIFLSVQISIFEVLIDSFDLTIL